MIELATLHRTWLRGLMTGFLCLSGMQVCLAQGFDAAAVRRAVDGYLRVQTQGLPGQVSYTIDSIDERTALAPCEQFDVGTTAGARAWGRTSVSVRCTGAANWTMLIPVRIRVVSDYLVSARSVAVGHRIEAADVLVQRADLAELPTTILTDPAQAIGQLARTPIQSGQPLRADMLRALTVVQQGQTVRLISRGEGFEVSGEGRALNNGSLGQPVQVRLINGQVVTGLVSAPGVVELGR